jgi:hypothetical protein
MPALPLDQVRSTAAAALAPTTAADPSISSEAAAATLASDTDPVVLVNVFDAVVPPALMLTWDDPWVAQQAIGRGPYIAQLAVYCFASRIEPGPGVEVLEYLVCYTVTRLGTDASTAAWPLTAAQAPRKYAVSGIELLGARLTYRMPVSLDLGGP